MRLRKVWWWIECHVLGHHDDKPISLGWNGRECCSRCKRLGETIPFEEMLVRQEDAALAARGGPINQVIKESWRNPPEHIRWIHEPCAREHDPGRVCILPVGHHTNR